MALSAVGGAGRPSGAFSIEAAPDGSTAARYRQDGDARGRTRRSRSATGPSTTSSGSAGWPASTGQGPKTGDLGDQADEGIPPVDADGRGNGWTAFIDGDMSLQIVRFDLADPGETPTIFTVERRRRPIPENQTSRDETESRSDPRVDVNPDGDVVVTFVEARRRFSQDAGLQPPVDEVYADAEAAGDQRLHRPVPRSPTTATRSAVNQHDPAIVDNGDITVALRG